jgi:hypothetical protein
LEVLDLRGSALSGSDWVEGFQSVGRRGPGLKDLNLSFTNITRLPFKSLRNIRCLSLSSCSSLSTLVLTNFLKDLPSTVETLDLSRLDQIPYSALVGMRVVGGSLREIRVVGIDHLTRMDIRGLKRHWERQRIEQQEEEEEEEEYDRLCLPIPVPLYSKGYTSSYKLGIYTPPTTPPKMTILDGQYSTSYPKSPTFYHDNPLPQAEVAEMGINIVHSAILESEDEAGYRQFIGEVVEGTLSYGIGRFGTRFESGWNEEDGGGTESGYVEVDQGGLVPV